MSIVPKNFNPNGNFLFSYEDYINNPRSKPSLKVRCLHCGQEYFIAPNEFERKYKEWRNRCEKSGKELPFNAFRFCSAQCLHDQSPKHKTVKLKCAYCGKEFERRMDVANLGSKSGEVFCSKRCHASWRKANNVAKGDKFVADISQNPNGNFLFTQEEYEATLFPQSRYKKLLPICCLTCGKPFLASAKQVNNLFTSSDKDKLTLKYCSRDCRDKASEDQVTVYCAECGKPLNRQRYELNVKKKFFCNRHCFGKYFAKHTKVITGKGRSKLEDLVDYILQRIAPNLNYESNNREVLDGLELDLYFPDINVGIEINGAWHSVFGKQNSLSTIQERDSLKRTLCKEKGIRLLQADFATASNYTPSNVRKFYPQKIREIISFLNESLGEPIELPRDLDYICMHELYKHRKTLCAPSTLKSIQWSRYIKPEDLEPND